MDRPTARRIKSAAVPYMDTNYNHVNIFILGDGRVDIEPVAGSLGAGAPANPERYAQFWLNVPLGWLEDVDTIMEL